MIRMERRQTNAKEILGVSDLIPGIPGKWKPYYRQLMETREKIVDQKSHLSEMAKEEQPSFSEHIGDAGTDQYDQDFTLSLISAGQDTLYEIEQALNRIKIGSYGICELTGQPIEPDRLGAIPWTRFSAVAQRQIEENGAIRRIALSKRGDIAPDLSADDDDDNEE